MAEAPAHLTMPEGLHPLRMGLEPLLLEDWLVARDGDGALLSERARIISAHLNDVIAYREDGLPALRELMDLPSVRSFVPGQKDPPINMLKSLGISIAEDICILTSEARGYFLTGAVLCFPNRWNLRDKIGHHVTAIHDPVPDYAAEMANTVDRFLEKLRPMRAYVRDNWGISASPALYHPEPAPPVNINTQEDLFLRREEQSFLKLPSTGAVIFSIRTTITPWMQVPEDMRASITTAVRALSPEWRAYKALEV